MEYVKKLIGKDEYNKNRNKRQEVTICTRDKPITKICYTYSNADLSKIFKFDIGVF